MTAQDSAGPVEWEKDVAGTLDLSQHLEAGLNVSLRMSPAQRVIQEPQRVRHPGFAGAVLHAREATEEGVARIRIGRERRHDERESRLSVRIRDARMLFFEDRVSVMNVPQRKLLGHIDKVAFRERQPGNRFLFSPHTLEICETFWSGDRA